MTKKKVCPRKSQADEKKIGGNFHPDPIITDPQGCYTGRPLETWETPVQDADDL